MSRKTEHKQEKIINKQQCVYEVSNDTSPQIKYLIINIINITLMTQLTIVKVALIQGEHSNDQYPNFSSVFASPFTPSNVLNLSYIA